MLQGYLAQTLYSSEPHPPFFKSIQI
jgi:hypothetical protein